MVDEFETTIRDRDRDRRSTRPSPLERSVDIPIDEAMLLDSVKMRATTTIPDSGPRMEPSSTRLMRAEPNAFDPTATIRTVSNHVPSRPPPRVSSRPPPRYPSRAAAPRNPSRFPRRSTDVPDPSVDVPTKIHQVPVELLSKMRTTAQRVEDDRVAQASQVCARDLSDTDECPTADLSDAQDLEWVDE